MQSKTLTHSRQTLISLIEHELCDLRGFTRTGDKFAKVFKQTVQAARHIIINGQRMVEPPVTIDVELTCDLCGTGECIDSATGNSDPFELLKFQVSTQGESQELNISVYYDNPSEFSNILKQYFDL